MKTDIDRHIEKHLKDNEFKIYFDRAEAKRKIAQKVAVLRKANHLTQTELAREVGTRQQVISRLENPTDNRLPSLDFLNKIARALNKKLVLSLE